ncbi:hypothetical protein B0J17DRAFT_224527 [Rhizoctonia solani]|nr:hypothetical protein B0J17DRAFT_224527 [Rhizoctonia solani]
MKTIKSDGRSSLFSHEYGFVLFQILLFSLGSSFLSRSGGHNVKNAREMMVDPRYFAAPISDIFFAHVASSLYEVIMEVGPEHQCDWIFGWGDHARDDQIISQDQTKSLIDMLWEDRVDFMRAMSSTFTPGLAALSFLNWRYTRLNHKSSRPNHDLLKRTSEIHWHCALITGSSQDSLVMEITDQFCILANLVPAKGKSMFQRSEGGRAILEAYISRLTPTNLAMYRPLPITMLPMVLELIVPNLETGVDDLLPSLLKVTLDRLWEVLREEKFTYNPLLACIGLTLEQIR